VADLLQVHSQPKKGAVAPESSERAKRRGQLGPPLLTLPPCLDRIRAVVGADSEGPGLGSHNEVRDLLTWGIGNHRMKGERRRFTHSFACLLLASPQLHDHPANLASLAPWVCSVKDSLA
jgi:hypothetical protein